MDDNDIDIWQITTLAEATQEVRDAITMQGRRYVANVLDAGNITPFALSIYVQGMQAELEEQAGK